jgi:hypothetical protein
MLTRANAPLTTCGSMVARKVTSSKCAGVLVNRTSAHFKLMGQRRQRQRLQGLCLDITATLGPLSTCPHVDTMSPAIEPGPMLPSEQKLTATHLHFHLGFHLVFTGLLIQNPMNPRRLCRAECMNPREPAT